jgi:hypothetical protein
MESVEILRRYPPPGYSVRGHIEPGPGGTFVASAVLVSESGERIPLNFLPPFPHNTRQEALAQIESFARGNGYKLTWDD